jgi:hypothetical protein
MTAPFWRLADKLGFIVGTFTIVSFSYLIGKYPNDIFYTYYVFTTIVMLFLRVLHYYHCGWHYYISDFCYYVNVLVLYLITYDSHNPQLVKMCFLYSNGAIAFAIYQFRNSLVLHKIDILTNLGIHILPMLVTYHIRWFTIPDQANQPIQRFCDLPVESDWPSYLRSMIFMPVLFYAIWSVNYSMLNFKIAADRIKRKGRENMYQLFSKIPLVVRVAEKYKLKSVSPIAFMSTHFVMFIVTHLMAMVQYHYFWLSTLVVGLYSLLSVWNGACFYMEYFCKKYEQQLEELEQMHKDTHETGDDI